MNRRSSGIVANISTVWYIQHVSLPLLRRFIKPASGLQQLWHSTRYHLQLNYQLARHSCVAITTARLCTGFAITHPAVHDCNKLTGDDTEV